MNVVNLSDDSDHVYFWVIDHLLAVLVLNSVCLPYNRLIESSGFYFSLRGMHACSVCVNFFLF